MADNPIILNNSGDDNYNFAAREWVSNPIKCKALKVILADDSQIAEILEIRSKTSTGAQDVRRLSFSKFVSASNRNSLIIEIPLTPELILDGSTSFKLSVPALSQVLMIFYYNRSPV